MKTLLRNRDYRRLFTAQLVSLLGTGLATVALGLLAYDLAGPDAGVVLGTALAVKMVAYVTVSPVVGALADRVPRRSMMVVADLVRAGVVLALPFVAQLWQVYLLIAVLQSASATFTPVFQSVLPDVLTDEEDYTTALSASQFAVAAENIVSPLLAAAVLTVLAYSTLFVGTAAGFLASATLVLGAAVPVAVRSGRDRFVDRITAGVRTFAVVPALRAVLAFDLVIASAGAITLVSTVNVVRDVLGGTESAVALLLAAAGTGTAIAAVLAPRLLRTLHERSLMLAGTAVAIAAVAVAIAMPFAPSWGLAAGAWAGIGLGTGFALMPTGRVIRRAAANQDRPAVFAAQFSLSHLCWLLTYPLTGYLGSAAGFSTAWSVLLVLAAASGATAYLVWPRRLTRPVPHIHDSTTGDHVTTGREPLDRSGTAWTHAQEIMPDDLHRRIVHA